MKKLSTDDLDRSKRLRDAISYLDGETWRRMYESSKKVTSFTATKRVDSESLDPKTRKLCDKGDAVKVLMWECSGGPTRIVIESQERATKYTTSVQFSWVLEMGASENLRAYMPPSGYTWDEVISALDSAE